MNWIEWTPALLLLMVSSGLAIAYNRLRGRADRSGHDRSDLLQLFEQSNDGLFVLDFVSGAIHRANGRAASMLGYLPEDLAKSTIFDLHFSKDLHRSASRIADAWAQGGLVYDDIPFRKANGDALSVECSAKVTSYNNRPAILLHARDITERLRLQAEVDKQSALVAEQNEEMRSGLRYAQGIQQAMLPALSQLRSAFPDAFVLYKPRDIVSGDFYWCARRGPKSVLVVGDCTGHGVPGALLTMTGITLLQLVVIGRGLLAPARILEELRKELMLALVHQEGEQQVRDGMNLGIIVYDRITRECEFSGALCPLYVARQNAPLEELKGDRIPIGAGGVALTPYTPHLIQLEAGDRLYMVTDGYADQFGGPQGKKLKSAGLRELLVSTAAESMGQQGRALEEAFAQHRGSLDQVDDVTIVGIRA